MSVSTPIETAISIPNAPKTRPGEDTDTDTDTLSPLKGASSSQFSLTFDQIYDNKDLSEYNRLYRAAFKGDWKAYLSFYELYPGTPVDVAISTSGKTVLHIAAASGQADFVEKLIAQESMTAEMLEKTDSGWHTALFHGVAAGNFRAVKAMFEKNPRLAQINNRAGDSPILESALLGNRELLEFLFWRTITQEPEGQDPRYKSPFRDEAGVSLLNAIIAAEFYDIAIHLVDKYPEVATKRALVVKDININRGGRDVWEKKISKGNSALDVLAQRCSSFESGSQLGFWQRRIYPAIHVISPTKRDTDDIKSPLTTEGTKDHNLFSQKNDLEKGIVELQGKKSVNKRTLREDFASKIWRGLRGLKLFWDKTILIVPCIKRVHDTKLKHQKAVELVKYICEKVGKLKKQKDISDLVNNPFLVAAEYGTVDFIRICLDAFPGLMWIQSNGYTILHYCIIHRQEKVFEFMHEKSVSPCQKALAAYQVENGNTILHLAGRLASQEKLKKISGAALQMQREIQWFKAVEKITKPTYRELQNTEDEEYDPLLQFKMEKYRLQQEEHETLLKLKMEKYRLQFQKEHDPLLQSKVEKYRQEFQRRPQIIFPQKKKMQNRPRDLFLKEHKALVDEGQTWMRDLATSCTVVGALITTMVFAAGFTVPGGNNQDTGIPILLRNKYYKIFAISNAIALISSLTSVLIFLSALTSRYNVDDFLVSLPRKVIFGLATLFISMASMFITFIATYYIMFHTHYSWVALLVALLITVPGILFVVSQFPLFVELVSSTYGRGVLHHQSKRV